jgi:hypothetical protein
MIHGHALPESGSGLHAAMIIGMEARTAKIKAL